MVRRPARYLIPAIVAIVLAFVAGRAVAGFYTEVLWFRNAGYIAAFWTRFATGLGVRLVAAAVGAAIVLANLWYVARRLGPVHVRRRYGNLEISEQVPRRYVTIGITLTAVLTGIWLSDVQFGGERAMSILTALRSVRWGIADPLFERDVSFYVFSLPVYFQIIDFLLLSLFWALLFAVLGYALVGAVRWRKNRLIIDDRPRVHLAMIFAGLVAALGVRYWFGRYGILFEGSGFNGGVGYTDVYAKLLAQRILAIMSIGVAATIVFGARRRNYLPAAIGGGLLLLAALLLGYFYPSVIQKLRVEPNQFAREQPYIRWNIDFTRRAYALDQIERQRFDPRPPGSGAISAADLDRLPLWDPEPLQVMFTQTQSLFNYYQFPDVDYDRYDAAGGRRQVAISVREFSAQGLPDNARTWQTLHLNPDYVRGIGAVVTPADEAVRAQPVYWIQNPSVLRAPEAPPAVELTQPSIYYGETMEEYVIVNARPDTLRGATRAGDTGIPIDNFVRVLAFASRFSDKNLLFSGQLGPESRVIFRRRLDDRLSAIAPFLSWDKDPHPVIYNGRVHWIVDGYSATDAFPIARQLVLQEHGRTVRYLRASVKATVDAVTGETRLYAVAPDEPIVQTWSRVYPGLIRPLSEMPAGLREHLRYPAMLVRAQTDILEEYHVTEAEAFYSGQDYWQLPQERGVQGAQAFRPLYTFMRIPGGTEPEFLVTAPFIARQRQNMTALLLVRNDGENYGRVVLLELPRDRQIPGPTQVEALVEQDPLISPQLSLWRQAGSEVNIGHVRIVTGDSAFLYVVPLFLAAQGSPIPELHRVIASDGERVHMAETLEEALAVVAGETPRPRPIEREAALPGRELPIVPMENWPRRALDLLDAADRALQSRDWAAYGARLEELRVFLRQLSQQREQR